MAASQIGKFDRKHRPRQFESISKYHQLNVIVHTLNIIPQQSPIILDRNHSIFNTNSKWNCCLTDTANRQVPPVLGTKPYTSIVFCFHFLKNKEFENQGKWLGSGLLVDNKNPPTKTLTNANLKYSHKQLSKVHWDKITNTLCGLLESTEHSKKPSRIPMLIQQYPM